MNRIVKVAAFAAALTCAAGSAVALSYFNAGVGSNEVIKFAVNLPPDGPVSPVEVDLAAQRLPKSLVDPDTVTFRARGLVNVSDKPLAVRIGFSGDVGTVGLTWNGGDFDVSRIGTIAAGGKANLYMVLKVPAATRAAPVPLETHLIVTDADLNREIARVPLRVFNSAAGGQPFAAIAASADPHAAHMGH